MRRVVWNGVVGNSEKGPPMTDLEISTLRAQAESGDSDAADQLVESAAEAGDLATLERLAQQGNTTAAEVLEELTAE
jgi:hypothetical protein